MRQLNVGLCRQVLHEARLFGTCTASSFFEHITVATCKLPQAKIPANARKAQILPAPGSAMRIFRILLAVSASANVLTKETWDNATSGKMVFVKFFAPWCGHCKRMKPDWDKLMDDFKNNANTLVADVDCVGEGKALCSDVGIKGYPTIKYGDPSGLMAYEGARDHASLKVFAQENLAPQCGPTKPHLCDNANEMLLESYMEMSTDDLKASIEEKDAEMQAADDEVEQLLKRLQEQYEVAEKRAAEIKKGIQEEGLSLMKSVLAYRLKTKSEL